MDQGSTHPQGDTAGHMAVGRDKESFRKQKLEQIRQSTVLKAAV